MLPFVPVDMNYRFSVDLWNLNTNSLFQPTPIRMTFPYRQMGWVPEGA